MTKLFSAFALIWTAYVLVSCTVQPRDIQYGEDHCAYCDMTVVNKQHAAQYVSNKGRTYVFDAIECMVWQIENLQNEDNLAFMLVANYANPGQLINAKDAFFLISERIKSPMGANLSAFDSQKSAIQIAETSDAEIYDWNQLKKVLKQ